MNKLANLKIGRKLALLLTIAVGSMVGIGALGLWALRAVRSADEQQQIEADKMMSAQRAWSDLAVVNAVVGHITQSSHCENCHGTAQGGDRTEQARLAQESRSLMSDLKSRDNTTQGSKLASDLETAGTAWLDVNRRVLDLGQAGKRKEALALYVSESVPSIGPIEHAVTDYVNWQQPRVAEGKQRAVTLARRMPIPVALLSLLAAAIATLLGVLITRGITAPLGGAIHLMESFAGGDLTCEVPAGSLARKDEIGMLAAAIQGMSKNLRGVIGNINEGIGVLSSSSAGLSASSTQMSEGSQQASGRAHSVATAAEEMTANVVSVAAGMEQATNNLTSVASATEQMTATIGEIAGNSEKARRITEEANRQASTISEQMNELGAAAEQIGKVTETITEISSQTNLLALNATIEAARAGSAGKGFAVVANEIKELAKQTAAATEDIKAKIAGVQASTVGGIAGIGKIAQVIHEVGDIVTSIAAAIEEQSTVTRDIARNIAEASTGVGDASRRISETSQATAEISREIAGVDQAAGQMASGSEQVKVSAADLSRAAARLEVTAQHFKV